MRILLGMSGGLDSTYAAYELMSEGHKVEGAVLKMHGYTDVEAAAESAASLGITLHTIDCREVFDEKVVSNFLSEYPKGRTPNPCIICNSEVKFRELLRYAEENGFDAIATGHYAKVVKREYKGECRYTLSSSKDSHKDQTYVLWRLQQDVLSKLMLPLSETEKSVIREKAANMNLKAADRDESQEICFVPSGDYADFIEERTEKSPRGNFVDENGKILGEHQGIIRYTVGQRKGLGIAMGTRVFITKINPINNEITLSPSDSFKDEIFVSEMNFVGMAEPDVNEEIELSVKVRYHAPKVKCIMKYLGGGRAEARLQVPQRAVTPGQSAVFYDGDLLAAGGFIE
ncbi:MAG: tRNA 2-thiouridine(34) synthase MnmA [Ruminococcaceae bacterium]|nr:tRNA 2-thiouridine(34) synthase MnmA [Oscillospiraceae bacterium]